MAKKYVRTIIVSLFVLTLVSTCFIGPVAGENESNEIKIIDGTGKIFTFDSPVEHIITSGRGATATAIQLGCLDKISVCDSYSKIDPDPVFDGLRERVNDGKTLADGNGYDSGREAYISNIITSADKGDFDKENDVIIITLSKTNTNLFLKEFVGKEDFRNILIWYDGEINDYDKVVDFCSKMSLILTGFIDPSIKNMSATGETISNKLAKEGITENERVLAFFITSTSGAFKVGNIGSIANSMIDVAGGKSITINEEKQSTYQMTMQELIDLREAHPGKLVIFADSSMSESELDSLIDNLSSSGSVTIIVMKSLWNNYSIECMNGVMAMACAMYPQFFEGEVQEYKSSKGDDTMLYVISGFGAVALLAAVVYFLDRHHI